MGALLPELFPDAPIYTLVHDPEAMHGVFADKKIYTSYLQRLPFARRRHRLLPPLMPSAIEQFDLSRYDVVIVPNLECMGLAQIEGLAAYVKRGGGLLIGQDTALYDLWHRRRIENPWEALFGADAAREVVADATALGSDIKSSGHVAVYGITFDTNKAEVKPESKPTLDEIAKLLKQEPALKLKVVGHTDMTGLFDANMKLSQARAEAVVQALVSQYGIAAPRLKGYGVGPLAPVASNAAEEGRAKNRRVELVKQ